jgi:hypothetical protein
MTALRCLDRGLSHALRLQSFSALTIGASHSELTVGFANLAVDPALVLWSR